MQEKKIKCELFLLIYMKNMTCALIKVKCQIFLKVQFNECEQSNNIENLKIAI